MQGEVRTGGFPVFMLVDPKDAELNPVTGLSKLKAGYGVETRIIGGKNYALVFTTAEKATHYVRQTKAGPLAAVALENEQDFIEELGHLAKSGLDSAIFDFVETDTRFAVVSLNELVATMRKRQDSRIGDLSSKKGDLPSKRRR